MHAPEHITKDEISEVYPKVAQTIAEALGREPDEMTLTTNLTNFPSQMGFTVTGPFGKAPRDCDRP